MSNVVFPTFKRVSMANDQAVQLASLASFVKYFIRYATGWEKASALLSK